MVSASTERSEFSRERGLGRRSETWASNRVRRAGSKVPTLEEVLHSVFMSPNRCPTLNSGGAGPGSAVEVEGAQVRARVPRAGTAVPGLLRDLHDAGIALASIEVVRPTLDDVFLTLTGRSLRDAESTADAAAGAETPEEK